MSWLGLWNKFKWIWIKITQLSYKKLQNGKHSILISFNWLWPGDIIGWCISWSTLAQVMACYPMAPCHYLNQFWLFNWVLWHVPQCNFTWSDQEFNLKHGQEKLYFIIATSPRSQCIKLIAAEWCTCVSDLTFIGSDNGLSPARRQALSEPILEYS